jgi:hypothetical protein
LGIEINKRPFVIPKAIQITKGKEGGERREEGAHPAPGFQHSGKFRAIFSLK